MDKTISTRETTGLRAKLRGTWLHDFINKARDLKRRVMRHSEGEAILLQRYLEIHGVPLNMADPRTFTEKLFRRMITWNRGVMNPRFTQLSDKYEVRAYVANKVGEDHLIKLLWYGDDARAIPFDTLPAEYVIKPSHSCGKIIIVKGHADQDDVIRQATGWLGRNYYWSAREYQYYDMKPRIVVEQYLQSQDGGPPLDYKVWCFNGRPLLIQVRDHAREISPIYDTTWNLLDLSYNEGYSRPAIPKPENLDELLAVASQLSVGFGFVRVDVYSVNGRIYFGELTFTPAHGVMKFNPDCWDLRLGEKWDLSLE